MKVSVIIPIYKVETYIEDCIRSVIAQKNVDLDIVLVDDCSPDNSSGIACELLKNAGLSFQIIRHDVNRGLSAARNSGIRAAKGEYVYFLDSDDELMESNSLAHLLKVAEDTHADCVAGNYVTRYEDSHNHVAMYSAACYFSSSESLQAYADTLIPIPAWNKLIKKSFIEDKNLYFKEGVLNEDELWCLDMVLSRVCIALSGTNSYLYKIRSGSIMQQSTVNKLKSACEIYALMVDLFGNKMPTLAKEKRAVALRLDYFSWFLYKQLLGLKSDDIEKYLLYQEIRQIQLRYCGYGTIRYLRSFHIYLPASVGWRLFHTVLKSIMK